MAVTKIQFKPGINKENTNYANEGGYYNCDKVRFRSGTPEKIGGWINQTSSGSTFHGVNHSLFCWVTYDAYNLLAVGTNQGYYIENGGTYHDITPIRTTTTLGSNPITTVSGSKLVTISATGHGATATTYINISGATAVGGLTISGQYEIVNVIDGNSYNILATSNASSSATGGGSAVVVAYNINAGSSATTTVGGYGAGTYGGGGYGVGSGGTTNHPIQLWSQCLSGQDLVFATRSGSIYYWLKDTSAWSVGVTLASYSNTITQTTKAATFGGVTSTITVPDVLFLYPGQVISGTNITPGTYITTAWNGTTSVPISAPTLGASSGSYTFSYSGQSVPTQTNFIISSDINGFVIALGANPYDPTNLTSTFDPMLVRWSDQSNPYLWVPDTSNQSGEQHLSNGSALVTARNNRQEILVWSNTALYSMQYLGPPYVFGFSMIMDGISIISQNAAIVVNNVAYWMGKDKFYTYTGQVNTLDCQLRHFVFNNLNLSQPDQVVCGSNPGYNEVWWLYPSLNSNVNDSYVIFNYNENIWYYGTLNRSSWLNTGLRNYPMAAFSIQKSYLNTALNSSATTMTLIDGTSYPSSGTVTIDSEQITYTSVSGSTFAGLTRGANGTTAASHAAYAPVSYYIPNQILFHEYGVDDQATGVALPLVSYLESADFDIGDGDHISFVWRVIPDLTFEGSSATNPQIMLTVKSRMSPGSAYTSGVDTPTVTRTATYPVEQFTPQVYTRVRGRQLAFRIDSTMLGVQWQGGAMRLDIRQDGRR